MPVVARACTIFVTDLRSRLCCAGIATAKIPERRLPILSTYLGHAHVTDTYWYLTGTPELLGAAGKRLEKRWEGLECGIPLIFLPCCSRSSRLV